MSDRTPDDDEMEASSAPLIEHLAELRTRIMWSLAAYMAAVTMCFFVADPLLNFLVQPIAETLRDLGQDPRLIFTAPQEKFFVLFRIAMLAGLALAFPVIAHQMWRFVAPGLYKNEKRAFLPFIVASPVLFLAGAAFAHYIVTPMAMNFFIGFSDFLPSITDILSKTDAVDVADEKLATYFLGSVKESLDITLKFIFAFGLCFQLPVLMTLLGMAGIVTAEAMRRMRKYAVVAILTLAAIVTPPDVMSQVILFSVVYLLYEISIFLVASVENKREARLRAEGYYDDEEEAPKAGE